MGALFQARKSSVSLLAIMFFIALGSAVQPTLAAESPFSWNEALQRGVVDFNPNPWLNRGYSAAFNQIGEMNPGIVNRFGFMYGGPNAQYLSMVAELSVAVRAKLPRALMGTALPEHLSTATSLTIPCGGGLPDMKVVPSDIVGVSAGGQYSWIDLNKQKAVNYYLCLGKFYIDNNITVINFEGSEDLLNVSANRTGAIQAYKTIQSTLNSYATSKKLTLYWGGDSTLSKNMTLQFSYQPIRVYQFLSLEPYKSWANKISRPGIGVGYSYVLSQKRITDAKASLSGSVKLFFYVDNFTETLGDDLVRFSELDGQNRRYMIEESAKIAKKNGAYFLPPLNHCQGCVSKGPKLGDTCWLTPDGSATQYDVVACGDVSALKNAISNSIDHQITTSIDFVNEWAVCSQKIAQRGDCGGCIYHQDLYLAPASSPLQGLSSASYGQITYSIETNGICRALKHEKLLHVTARVDYINSWAVCSNAIRENAGCNVWNSPSTPDSCIWHYGTQLENKYPSAIGQLMDVVYRRASNGTCTAVEELLK